MSGGFAVNPPPYFQTNRDRWNELVALHARSAFYDVAGFKAGKSSLRPLERAELGDGTGRSLLHLQCHFGLDTLSWARLGARVTGVDFSAEAIALARSLAAELAIDARFVCANLYDLPAQLADAFDIVFTSYGVLCWLPDLARWAEIVAHFLKPGGTFYLAEIHPLSFMLDDRPGLPELRLSYPYFHAAEPIRSEASGSYTDRDAVIRNTVSYEWSHSLGDVVTALIAAGLRLEFLHEFPYSVYPVVPTMEHGADGWWRLRDNPNDFPFLFSLRARK